MSKAKPFPMGKSKSPGPSIPFNLGAKSAGPAVPFPMGKQSPMPPMPGVSFRPRGKK